MMASECRHCRAMLPAYINRELKPRARRRVGAHLQKCAACDAEYFYQRALARALSSEIPTVGRAAALPLDRMWNGIQAQLAQPSRRYGSIHAARFRKRYGAAALLLMAALILPSVLSGTPKVFAFADVPTQQTPNLSDTPERTHDSAITPESTPVAMIPLRMESNIDGDITPSLQSNYAPDFLNPDLVTETVVSASQSSIQVTDTPDGV